MIDFYEIVDDLEHVKKITTDPVVQHTLQLMIEKYQDRADQAEQEITDELDLYYRERAFQ